jgi:hypothetical protein
MDDHEMHQGAEMLVPMMDRKAVFDLGYNAYEDGKVAADVWADIGTSAGYPDFVAMWHYGWHRAQEDSPLFRRVRRFD